MEEEKRGRKRRKQRKKKMVQGNNERFVSGRRDLLSTALGMLAPIQQISSIPTIQHKFERKG